MWYELCGIMSKERKSQGDLWRGSEDVWIDFYHMIVKVVWFCLGKYFDSKINLSEWFLTKQFRLCGKPVILYLPEFHPSCKWAPPLADPIDHHQKSGKHVQRSREKRGKLRTMISSSSSAEASCIQGTEVVSAHLHFSLSPKLAGHQTTLESGR